MDMYTSNVRHCSLTPNKFPMAYSRIQVEVQSDVTSDVELMPQTVDPDHTEPPRQLYPVEALRLKISRER